MFMLAKFFPSSLRNSTIFVIAEFKQGHCLNEILTVSLPLLEIRAVPSPVRVVCLDVISPPKACNGIHLPPLEREVKAISKVRKIKSMCVTFYNKCLPIISNPFIVRN